MSSWTADRIQAASDDGSLRRALLALFILSLIATAWVHDDAFISFRSLENLSEGRGLTWNDTERVQVFTHPLWFFVHAAAYAVTGEPYYTTLAICFVCTLSAVWLLAFRLPASAREGTIVLAALILSQGFLDYSTSGLENPLTHLLIVLIVWFGWSRGDPERNLTLVAFLTSLALLNRVDLLPLLLPGFALQLWRAAPRRRTRALLALGLPLLVWEAFSLVYFGFLVPNTAPAKLATGISLVGRVAQGVNYFGSNLVHDGFTLLFGGWAAVTLWKHASARGRAAVLGVGLQVVYLVSIGADYMSGRALTAPFTLLMACLLQEDLLVRHPPRLKRWVALATMVLLVKSTASLAGPAIDPVGIGDERRFWHPHTGLVYAPFISPWPETERWRIHPGRDCELEGCIRSHDTIGLVGYFSGPEVHLLDNMAIADAFRARLPGIRGGDFNLPGRNDHLPGRTNWRPGHVERPYPAGFIASLESGENRIEDPELATFYDAIRLVTSGPLWTRERWAEIWKVNTGGYDDVVARWAARNPELFVPQDGRPQPEYE